MTEPVNLDAKRKEKAKRCDICGAPVHEFVGQCPRVCAITEETDGSVTYHLRDYEPEPLAG